MTIEQMKQVVENYENFKEYLSKKFVEHMEKSGKEPKFYKGKWSDYSFYDTDFDAGTVTFVDDDFYSGYDLPDYDYQTIPLSGIETE